jgi:hypothetical protein
MGLHESAIRTPDSTATGKDVAVADPTVEGFRRSGCGRMRDCRMQDEGPATRPSGTVTFLFTDVQGRRVSGQRMLLQLLPRRNSR